VTPEQLLRFLPEEAIHNVGRCSLVGDDHSLPFRQKWRTSVTTDTTPPSSRRVGRSVR
jgi:hypothetical protein